MKLTNFNWMALILLPVLTIVIWLIWVFVVPSVKDHFLASASQRVERRFLPEKKRRSATRNI